VRVANEQNKFFLTFIGDFVVLEVGDHFLIVKNGILVNVFIEQEFFAFDTVIILLFSIMDKELVNGGTLAIVADAGV
jgi:hypothetical protein